MEGFQNWVGKIKEDLKDASDKASSASSSSSSFKPYSASNDGVSAALHSDQSRIIVARPVRGVTLWACAKVGSVAFVVGLILGYTLKRRVKRWAAKILRGSEMIDLLHL